MKKNTTKITLKFHPNKAMGEKYEIVKITNAVVVTLEAPGKAKTTYRVSDYVSEETAKELCCAAEVTVIPE